jgi:RNA polymerase sigma-70 factor (ECF subfamily)
LFREYQSQVFAWVVRIVRDRGAAEELTVETFWRIYNAHGRFDPHRSFEAWARRIATNVALDWLKKSRGAPALLPADDAGRNAGAPRDPAVHAELQQKIALAFQSLSPKLRVVAALALIEEEPYAEIASALDISVAAVKARVFRATRILRTKLMKMGITP